MCHVSIAIPPFGAPAPAATAIASSSVRDVRVERHDLVGDRRRVVLGRVGAQLGEALGHLLERRRRRGDVADLDVVGLEDGGGVEEQAALPVGRGAALVAGVDEPVHEELELEVPEAGVVEDRLHLAQRVRLEHVLEVGVPDPDAREPDLGRLLAAVAPAEQATTRGRRAPRPGRTRSSTRPTSSTSPIALSSSPVAVEALHREQPRPERPWPEPNAAPRDALPARAGLLADSCCVCAYQPATDPASTGISIPVTNEASSEHSQTTAAATSRGLAEARHRLRAQDLLLALGRLVGHERRHDRAGADAVHADAVVGVLDRRVLRQAVDAVLARGVGAEQPHRAQPGVRRGVDDRPAAVLRASGGSGASCPGTCRAG